MIWSWQEMCENVFPWFQSGNIFWMCHSETQLVWSQKCGARRGGCVHRDRGAEKCTARATGCCWITTTWALQDWRRQPRPLPVNHSWPGFPWKPPSCPWKPILAFCCFSNCCCLCCSRCYWRRAVSGQCHAQLVSPQAGVPLLAFQTWCDAISCVENQHDYLVGWKSGSALTSRIVSSDIRC